MSEDQIRYDVLANEAMRGIIRTVLQRVQKRGLPGEHHFYITFDTTAAGAIVSKRLKEQYPEDMTIVLQHQFWDLLIYDDRFEVKLSFNGVPERLVVPYSAIKTFVDPSVSFGFSPNLFASATKSEMPPADQMSASVEGQDRDRAVLPRPAASADDGVEAVETKIDEPAIEQDEQPEKQTAEVVELDLFRKK
ncbi:MAG: SspB family protein [Rhodomicrobiaceae bacterium]